MSDSSDSSSPPQLSNNSSLSNHELHGRALTLIVASTVALILFLYFSFLFYQHKKKQRNMNTTSRSVLMEIPPQRVQEEISFSELPPLPVYVQLDEAGKKECAVCLADFLTGGTGRVLPVCGHAFHKECIEKWFKNHSTCPVCRANVKLRPVVDQMAADQSNV
ncbi:hypothetical protein LUZ60_013901 [Juncus effusus]|nr:hypothetical protein LUZ60_013901 [Juncus effusus]